MGNTMEGSAPWTRPQKQAVIGLPLSLGVAALMVAKVFAGPFDLPGWAPGTILAVVVALVVALFFFPRRSECPDERDWLIVIKAKSVAYGFLLIAILVPFALRRTFSEGPAEWDAELLAMGIAMMAQAVYFGTILLLYRRSTEG